MHLPRSVFSHRQLDLFLWLLKVNDVDDVPSVKSMGTLNDLLQKMCGIDSIPYKGALGHNYYVNSLSQIISQVCVRLYLSLPTSADKKYQEMANPKVRPNLSFFPEDTGETVSEARQARHWLHDAPAEKIAPMARRGAQDFYIHEPAMLNNGKCCIPVRWFERDKMLFARCWDMHHLSTDYGQGWRVVQSENYVVPLADFLKTFTELGRDAASYGIAHPSRIFGTFIQSDIQTECLILGVDVLDPTSGAHSEWKFTNPVLGNQWRQLAKGHRVVCFPIWMYCDDTSGNLSKKWNEHNSVLFTPAGLPCSESQKEFNIHFLSTSNIAPPLEMMDGIVQQIE